MFFVLSLVISMMDAAPVTDCVGSEEMRKCCKTEEPLRSVSLLCLVKGLIFLKCIVMGIDYCNY